MIDFLKDTSGKISSKRVIGFCAVIVGAICLLILFVFGVLKPADYETPLNIGKTFLIGGLSLLGVGTLEHFK